MPEQASQWRLTCEATLVRECEGDEMQMDFDPSGTDLSECVPWSTARHDPPPRPAPFQAHMH
jgi:hypothetical protein